MIKQIIYSPRPDITIYELALVLKIFTFGTLPNELKTMSMLISIYESLPQEAKRHFQIIEE
jgi:hypothetical protein